MLIIGKNLILVILIVFISGCSHQPEKKSVASLINHVVFVWFKDDVSQKEKAEILQRTHALKSQIPLIRELRAGYAIPSDRKIVDDSFDLGIYFSFDSKANMDAYLKHPAHVSFVKDFVKPKLKKLVVYDF